MERMAWIRPDTKVITGGKEMHWRCAAATCVGQVPTSRRTVSCTEALQVQRTTYVLPFDFYNVVGGLSVSFSFSLSLGRQHED